jgi:hypothetical protein
LFVLELEISKSEKKEADLALKKLTIELEHTKKELKECQDELIRTKEIKMEKIETFSTELEASMT